MSASLRTLTFQVDQLARRAARLQRHAEALVADIYALGDEEIAKFLGLEMSQRQSMKLLPPRAVKQIGNKLGASRKRL